MNAICKRLFDITFALFGLLLSAPIMVLVALAVHIGSPGNVIFCQKRLGLKGRVFLLYKFRKFLSRLKTEGLQVTVAADARMTRVGKILERTKLDELPQLWNILKGEMSFVGPRPETLNHAELFRGKYKSILDYKPGIFGPNQIAFRNESELYPACEEPESFYRRVLFPQKAEKDLAYFGKANCFKDFAWIIKGIWISIVGVVNWKQFIRSLAKSIAFDFFLIELAWAIANVLRFSGIPESRHFEGFLSGLWIFPAIILLGMSILGCYQHPLKYFSFIDAIRLSLAVSLAWLFGFLLLMGLSSRDISLYLVPIGWLLMLALLAIPRVWARLHYEKLKMVESDHSKRVLIYGSSKAGIALASWMKNCSLGLSLIGFLDDDPKFRTKHIAGTKVLGRESDIPTVNEVYHIDEIWMTFAPEEMKCNRILSQCKKHNIKLVILPELEPFSRFSPSSAEKHN